MIDPLQNAAVLQSIEPADAEAGTTTGAALDWSGYNAILAVIELGLIDASHTVDITLEECDTASGTYVTTATLAQKAVADDQASFLLGYARKASSKKYVRAKLVRGGSNSSLVGVTLVGLKPVDVPVS